jgi:hypothetical protein
MNRGELDGSSSARSSTVSNASIVLSSSTMRSFLLILSVRSVRGKVRGRDEASVHGWTSLDRAELGGRTDDGRVVGSLSEPELAQGLMDVLGDGDGALQAFRGRGSVPSWLRSEGCGVGSWKHARPWQREG